MHFLSEEGSLWGWEKPPVPYGRWAGFGRSARSNEILSGAQAAPRLLTLNLGTGGALVSGAGKQDFNTASISATPSPGYLFSSWTGDFISSDANTTLVMSANYEVNATFSPDTGDDDGDGLTNYDEWVTYSTDANNSDSDNDD